MDPTPELSFTERVTHPEAEGGSSAPSPSTPHEYVPKWQHIKEDLKYMFQIDVDTEADLDRSEIKQQMYTKALDELRARSPFALDYFIEEKLLSVSDIRDSDRAEIVKYAYEILRLMKNPSPMRKRTEELFLEETDILTVADLEEIEKSRHER
jgi:hypothetical protein